MPRNDGTEAIGEFFWSKFQNIFFTVRLDVIESINRMRPLTLCRLKHFARLMF